MLAWIWTMLVGVPNVITLPLLIVVVFYARGMKVRRMRLDTESLRDTDHRQSQHRTWL